MINNILNKYLNNEKSIRFTNYTLESIAELLRHLNNPQENFKSLHIAGTNGKGSTAYMLAEILQNSGYKTGLYTSPHLIKINERIKINKCDIDDKLLYKYINQIDNIAANNEHITPTYFDVLTAAAFAYFRDEAVDIAIIETGLGGRLDSTNVIKPVVSIITDISIDHINVLGDNISDITREKCGIIKSDVAVLTSNTNKQIVNIIEEISALNNSQLFIYNINFFTENIRKEKEKFVFDFNQDDYKLINVNLPLFPVHQVKNAALVLASLRYLKSIDFTGISDDIIYSTLEKINVPGRFQTLNTNPLIIYDPAHNFDALNNLIIGLEMFYPEKNKIFVISMMKDKADYKTLNLLNSLNVIYYCLEDERSYKPEEGKFKLITYDDNIIIDNLLKIQKDVGMIIFTGTFRIYEKALQITEILKNMQIG